MNLDCLWEGFQVNLIRCLVLFLLVSGISVQINADKGNAQMPRIDLGSVSINDWAYDQSSGYIYAITSTNKLLYINTNCMMKQKTFFMLEKMPSITIFSYLQLK